MKIFTILFCLIAITSFAQPEDNSKREMIITPVSVIPMDTERVLDNQAVIVKNGVITYVGDAKNAKPGKDAIKIDGKGKYLIPGLGEMHAHVPPNGNIDQAKDVLALFLANGVTTIRGMLGHPNHVQLRDMINNGQVVAPHFYTTGPSFNGQSVKTAEQGAQMVRDEKATGYDYLKIHPGLTKETYHAVAQEANKVKIPFVGHVPFDVGLQMAVDEGQSTIDHMDNFIEFITPGADKIKEQDAGLFGSWIAIRADESKIDGLVKLLADKKVWVVPTQALAERWQSSQPASVYLSAPEMKYMKPEELKGWENAKNGYLGNANFSKEKAEALVNVRRHIIKKCQDGGVGLLLGSDAPQIFNVPGFSVHHELKYLVDAGLTPYEALKTGTVNVAMYLNKSANSGAIKQGYAADLVLLNGNPLKDITQTKSVEGVMIGNKWLSKDYITSELKRLER